LQLLPGLVGPKRNQPVVAPPFGFADPLSVAIVLATPVAASVTTVGATGVMNDWIAPKAVPAAFWAMAQK
jgi:hypothetical protein